LAAIFIYCSFKNKFFCQIVRWLKFHFIGLFPYPYNFFYKVNKWIYWSSNPGSLILHAICSTNCARLPDTKQFLFQYKKNYDMLLFVWSTMHVTIYANSIYHLKLYILSEDREYYFHFIIISADRRKSIIKTEHLYHIMVVEKTI
jgi:hypothetical protein